eukprot:5488122-Alexandrium_andersonii.AAC.1
MPWQTVLRDVDAVLLSPKPKTTSRNTIRGLGRGFGRSCISSCCTVQPIHARAPLPRQVAPAFSSTIDDEGSAEQKQQALAASLARQSAWVKRKEAPGEHSSWRPQKRHRLGAKH